MHHLLLTPMRRSQFSQYQQIDSSVIDLSIWYHNDSLKTGLHADTFHLLKVQVYTHRWGCCEAIQWEPCLYSCVRITYSSKTQESENYQSIYLTLASHLELDLWYLLTWPTWQHLEWCSHLYDVLSYETKGSVRTGLVGQRLSVQCFIGKSIRSLSRFWMK